VPARGRPPPPPRAHGSALPGLGPPARRGDEQGLAAVYLDLAVGGLPDGHGHQHGGAPVDAAREGPRLLGREPDRAEADLAQAREIQAGRKPDAWAARLHEDDVVA